MNNMTLLSELNPSIRKRIPIGESDFKNLIEGNNYYVDKSLLIKEIIEDDSLVILLPRPRRFGKTLNMTMLKYFFEASDEACSRLFLGLAIEKHPEIMKYCGMYPVIYLTLKILNILNGKTLFQDFKISLLNCIIIILSL
jgi:hypothetical protein